MKKTILTLVAIVTGTFMAYAQYAPGDLYEKDGMPCIVLTVDESGEHGTLMSLTPSVYFSKALEAFKMTTEEVQASLKSAMKISKQTKNDFNATNKANVKYYTEVAPLLTKSGKENRDAIKKYCDEKKVDMKTVFPDQAWAASLGEDWYIAGDNELEDYSFVIGNGLGKKAYKGSLFSASKKFYEKKNAIEKVCRETAGFETAVISIFIESSTMVTDKKKKVYKRYLSSFNNRAATSFWYDIQSYQAKAALVAAPSTCACCEF